MLPYEIMVKKKEAIAVPPRQKFPLLFSSLFFFSLKPLDHNQLMVNILLSLIPPSSMIAPIRDLGNKFTSTTSNTSLTLTFELPTVFFPSNIGMDFFVGPSSNNYDKVRGRLLLTKGNISSDSPMSSMKSSVAYHERMEHNNTMVVNKEMNNISPALSYEDEQKKAL